MIEKTYTTKACKKCGHHLPIWVDSGYCPRCGKRFKEVYSKDEEETDDNLIY